MKIEIELEDNDQTETTLQEILKVLAGKKGGMKISYDNLSEKTPNKEVPKGLDKGWSFTS